MRRNLLTLTIVAAAAMVIGGGAAVANPIFQATLSGANAIPPNASTASGLSTVTLTGNTLTVDETFSGLSSAATGAHIHCCAPPGSSSGIAIPFPGFPAATSGTYTQTFDLANMDVYDAAFLTANGGTAAGAEADLIAGLNTVTAYANIHDATFPDGEISGWYHLVSAAVPEPASVALFASALLGLELVRRRSRR